MFNRQLSAGSKGLEVSENLFLSRYEWAAQCLKKLMPIAPTSIVWDVGAGNGEMLYPTNEAGGNWQGFDVDPQLPSVHRWNIEHQASGEYESPGIILLLDVLEHLRNPWLGLSNLCNVLRAGGYVVLTTPNPRWSRSRFYALANGYPACFTESDLDLNNHVFTPWPHIVRKFFTDAGLTIERYVTLDGPTSLPKGPFTVRYPLRVAFALLNMAVEKRDATACGMSYGMIARKNVVG